MKILKEFRMRVYEDGTIETREVKPTNDFDEILSDCSDKTNQSILTILQIKVLKEKATKTPVNYATLYNEAINIVAENLGLERATVHDKLERRMGKSAKEMKILVEDYFTKGNDDLKQVMLNSTKNTNNEVEDQRAIEELFKRLDILA